MTVKEGECTNSGPDANKHLNPNSVGTNTGNIILDKNDVDIDAIVCWDQMWGEYKLAATIAKLKKALDKKNGIAVDEINFDDMGYMQVD